MYHLLLVDDEDLTVQRLQSAIDWPSLGISRVFTASSMQQAQKLFAAHRIEIMVCDIEMPAGNGIQLLHWVREQGYPTVNIFLTGHADFSYARDALALQTLEYILKPVSFEEVERAVGRAVQQLQRQEEEAQRRTAQFFRLLVYGEIMPNAGSIQRTAQKSGLDYTAAMACTPLLIASKEHFVKKEEDGQWDALPAVRNIMEEVLNPLLCKPFAFSGHLLAFFPSEVSQEDAVHLCRQALESISHALAMKLLFFLGEQVTLDRLQDQAAQLLRRERETVQDSGVFLDSTALQPCLEAAKPSYALWRTMLEQGDPEGVTRHAGAYLDALPALNREALCRFYDGYWQMVCTLMASRGLPTHQLKSAYLEDATRSVPALLEWVGAVNQEVCSCLQSGGTGAVVDQVKAYIGEHIMGPVTRAQVAESVHLTPEYLSRLFRRETGMSLIEYITAVKMEAAQELLTHSDLPISQVASQLGYGNFAYFSQLFRARFQASPSDYRKLSRRQ